MKLRLLHLITLFALLLAGAGPLPVIAQDEIPPAPAPKSGVPAGADGLEPELLAGLPGQQLEKVAQVAAGGSISLDLVRPQLLGSHTCAVTTSGVVYCWGENTYGQLGNGTFTNSALPVQVVEIMKGATAVTAGAYHTCALFSTGQVACWGLNTSGQLGDNSFVNHSYPVLVGGIGTAVAISAGAAHTCALLGDGTVWCWGDNTYGQLGNKSNIDSSIPVKISSLSTYRSIAAGHGHTCAAISTTDLHCWGYNGSGQLGNGTTTNSNMPVYIKVGGLVNWVAAGNRHTCALMSTGTMLCWGYNAFGQLGNGSTTNKSAPYPVSNLSGAASITAGEHHTCARQGTGTLLCWGLNDAGQVGDGTTTTPRLTPVKAYVSNAPTYIEAGAKHTCAVLDTAKLQCWGLNGFGQLGIGTSTNQLLPAFVLAPLAVYSISPTSGQDNVPVRVKVYGSGFQDGSTVELVSTTTQAVIVLEDILIESGNLLYATIPAEDPASPYQIGYYDLKVGIPTGQSVTYFSAYNMLDGGTIDDLYANELDLVIASKAVYSGVNVNLYLTVRRLGGTADLRGVQVQFYLSDLKTLTKVAIGSPVSVLLLPPNSAVKAGPVAWTPPSPGAYILSAEIIPPVDFVDSDETNNTVQRYVKVLIPLIERVPPEVRSITVAGGADFTPTRKVTISTDAFDPSPGSGIAYLLFIEYAFNQSRGVFEPVQWSPWLFYSQASSNYSWLLDPTPGAHFIKVWAADKVGNISTTLDSSKNTALINYLPSKDYLSFGQGRIFLQNLKLGQTVNISLDVTQNLLCPGNADLYVWDPSGKLIYQDGASYLNPIRFTLTTKIAGRYQYEVDGGSRCGFTYALTFPEKLPLASQDSPSLLARGSPYSNSVPEDPDVGVPSAEPVSTIFLPAVLR